MKETHYLIFMGENFDRKLEIPFGESIKDSLLRSLDESFSEKKFIKEFIVHHGEILHQISKFFNRRINFRHFRGQASNLLGTI